jgi:2-dehydropantoate 2-reductase
MTPDGIHHVALRVGDVARSASFYQEILGLPETRRREEGGRLLSVWLDLGGAILMLERALRGSGPEEGSGHLLALRVRDLPAWEAHLQRSGVAIVDRTASTLYVQDPDGHRVGLSTYPG